MNIVLWQLLQALAQQNWTAGSIILETTCGLVRLCTYHDCCTFVRDNAFDLCTTQADRHKDFLFYQRLLDRLLAHLMEICSTAKLIVINLFQKLKKTHYFGMGGRSHFYIFKEHCLGFRKVSLKSSDWLRTPILR